MSRGDWFKHPKIRLISGLLVAVAFCASWVGYGLLQSAEYERQASANSAEYAKNTRDKVAKACLKLAGIDAVNCANNARDAETEYRYNQSDLVAQRQSALWAYIMAAAAVIGMGLSVIGVWLVWTTFRETKRSADSASNTYSAFVALERAIVKVHLNMSGQRQGRLAFGVWVTNIGKSSCLIKSYATAWQKTDRYDEIGGYSAQAAHLLLPHNEQKFIEWSKGRADDSNKYLRGIIVYTSPLGEHVSHFCFFVLETGNPEGGGYAFVDSKGDDWPADT